jgi:pyruvate/2-oxoglutarate dehydrogenase complex dihydrolipoamide dehydrogenase (E3) component
LESILPKDDIELSALLADQLTSEGVELEYGVRADRAERNGHSIRLLFSQGGQRRELEAERLLVAVGRQANVDAIGLENVGVAVDPGGIAVTPALRTRQPWLFAVGDVLGHDQFSHAAEYEARVAVQNAFFPLRTRADYRWMPWCTFSDPELAHLGPTEAELQKKGVRYRAYRWRFSQDDRARTDLRASGLVKLLGTPRGRLLGAHILGHRAGDLMNQVILGQKKGASLFDLALTVNIYPTLGLAIQRAADHWVGDYTATPWRSWLIRLFTRRAGEA